MRRSNIAQVSVKVAYVVKMYPRFSETFVISEILAHEAAGMSLAVFSLRPTSDTHFQDLLARVRSPVHYISADRPRVVDFWESLCHAAEALPGFWNSIGNFAQEDPRDVLQAVQLARQLHSGGFTHIHAHFASIATTVARMASRFAGIPYSFTAHAKDIFHDDVDRGDFERKLRDAAAVVTVSDHNLEYIAETYGTSAAVVRRLYNGLDLSDFSYSDPTDRQPLIIGVGRLVEKKGFGDLVRACAHLKDLGVRAHCRIVGSGLLEEELRSLIRQLGVDDIVELTGPLPQSEVRRAVSSAAVLVAPCVTGEDGNRDGLPTVLLEAMALGTPCVSTPVAGIPEAIHHEETGVLVQERDTLALADAIHRMLADPGFRTRIARSARTLMEHQFDVRRNSEELRRLFTHQALAGSEAA